MQSLGQKNTAVLGIGNPLMGDDGFGYFIIQELQKKTGINADIIDAGTDPGIVLEALLSYEYLILIDTLDFNEKPGTLCRVSFNDLQKIDQDLSFSIHHINPITMLKLVRQMQKAGKTLAFEPKGYLLGIQPKNISPGLGLSPDLVKALPRAVDFIIKTLSTKGEQPSFI